VSERRLIQHGSTVEVLSDQVVVSHPMIPTLRLARQPGDGVTYGPITSAGQWLTIAPRPRLDACVGTKVDARTKALIDATAARLGTSPARLVRAFIKRGLEQAEAARNA
jgi:hypothetical protein